MQKSIFDGTMRVDSMKQNDSNSKDLESGKKLSSSATRLENYMRTEINKDQFQVDIELEKKWA